MTRVFLVHDHEIVRLGMAQLVDTDPGLELVGESGAVQDALGLIAATSPDVVVLNERLSGGEGMALCRAIRCAHPGTRCMVVSADGDHQRRGVAVQAGASGYVLNSVPARVFLEGIHRVARGEIVTPGQGDESTRGAFFVQGPDARTPHIELTLRETQLLELITDGLTNRQIGARLGIAEKTVKNYVSGLLAKLGLQRRAQVVAYWALKRTRAPDV